MKRFLWLTVMICLLTSCSKLLDEFLIDNSTKPTSSYHQYIIRKGHHFAEGSTFRQVHKSELRFEVLFDSSAIYNSAKTENQFDINKLFGFSDCGTMHHENSARFGWRWNGTALEIHAYWYGDSVRRHEFIDTISIGKPTEFAIRVFPEHYHFEMASKIIKVQRHCAFPMIDGYKLHPYFGGDEPAPHDITIYIKEH